MHLQSTFATLKIILLLFYFDAKCTGVFKTNHLRHLKQCESSILDITWIRNLLSLYSSATETSQNLTILIVYRVDEPSLKQNEHFYDFSL